MKHLYIDTNPDGVTGRIHSEHYEMYTLLYALWEIPEYGIDRFKKKITSELKNNPQDPCLVFESSIVVPLNKEDFLIYDNRESDENLEKSYFYIKQEALWQAIRDYNQFDIYSKKYKRITISYDGNKVYFDLEPFETSKENE